MRPRGFTLIELLVVIAIIGLLSSVVLSAVSVARDRASNAAMVSEARQYLIALNRRSLDTGDALNFVSGYVGSWCLASWEPFVGACSHGASDTLPGAYGAQLLPYFTKPPSLGPVTLFVGSPPAYGPDITVGAPNSCGGGRTYLLTWFLNGNNQSCQGMTVPSSVGGTQTVCFGSCQTGDSIAGSGNVGAATECYVAWCGNN